ncbi:MULTISPECIES: hypothetical protein [unclassified Bacillus (in: firmicutes)]|uniref:hypothetical protein n=1 Tax=unclassified Bacillus (in: firmicutes) TaxID=185979 RepID=UPI0008E15EF2|nr:MULTISPECIES: hypothetical protein [unclassified Bacillus (in: firmicutes)]SFI90334.1 hypothetical protein SAMN04488574_10559 [Bacillus sp. 71mf]SFS66446.1 hypothetical protein SAMN04488145_102259 [Bacillus sp. 103mf]
MELGNFFFTMLITTFIQLASLVGYIILVGFVLGYLENHSRTYWTRAFGRNGFLLTSWIGTPIHEFGHAFMCVLFGHKIVGIQWFPTNTSNGYLGYVQHEYNPKSIYQKIGNFFIGVAPIFSGIAALVSLMYCLIPHSYSVFMNGVETNIQPGGAMNDMIKHTVLSSILLLKSIFTISNLLNPYFWLFLILAICISTHIALSKPDIQGALDGLITIFLFLFLFNVIGGILHFDSHAMIANIAKYNAYLLAFSSIAILFSCITLAISYILYQIKRKYI